MAAAKAETKPPSLATAFWLYCIVGNVAMGMFIGIAWPDRNVPLLAMLFGVLYLVWALTAVWDASDLYKGWSIWSGLAKAYVILNGAVLAGIVVFSLRSFVH